ncbi:glyoxalase/bleomycin resistance protein/dioxygenase [Catenovulum agarivorans DS-2]|uniref:Glyoxalase/bleomycin resistance protein/dioxygenase n=1 Tax=Catenovulum agarivorans DS-2 TaxID=1328313 RepID=W7QJZ1_9ALTE|nr:hypothetical protein [Catenovulum agarivorans]EWH12216.1 glyoxalase/bleomycin resistance protein/dioxygenase [Catenovulum agarivorans DS-2]
MNRPGYWLYSGNQPILHLNKIVDVNAVYTPGSNQALDHMAFTMPNMSNFINKLNQLAIEYHQMNYADRPTQIFLHDPAGVKLEVQFAGE